MTASKLYWYSGPPNRLPFELTVSGRSIPLVPTHRRFWQHDCPSSALLPNCWTMADSRS
ncbi:hypothetical protein SCLCIDRAFT_661110 [Scleroderma citrinum Foug A]|uniref:Uncharacterized protein n=1 Tax=Scleroderma citrinum Foug A TaxID=1036808 RepID=A0A0C3E6V8_9AGAM|nr:hypothetical protein SCLCIDRAFT_661110 [Scleroderma citrinum Foug A]